MIYLTYADPPSGVYSSQVCDVVNYLNNELKSGIRLVAFVSIQNFRSSRKKIKDEVAHAWVLPMLPKANIWQPSIFILALLCLWSREKAVIARGVLACNIALAVKKTGILCKVCYDGRGAIAAEWNEYFVAAYKNIRKKIHTLESDAVNKADYRISVSAMLVEYWKEKFGYRLPEHVIIPCTLNSDFSPVNLSEEKILEERKRFGYKPGDIILAYSGSVAGWQSFQLLADFLNPVLKNNPEVKVLFLSGEDENINILRTHYPEQVQSRWIKHSEVVQVLAMCDYGLLIREKTVTNRVASPTKFAEYLGAGLPVIISQDIGDYSEFTKQNQCGIVAGTETKINFRKYSNAERHAIIRLVMTHFTKHAQRKNYEMLLKQMECP